MSVKLIGSLITLFMLCSFDVSSAETTTNSSEVSEEYSDYSSEEIHHKNLVLIPIFNTSSIENPTKREKLLLYVLDELAKLAEKLNETSPLLFEFDSNLWAETDYYDEEKGDSYDSDNATKTEAESRIGNESETETDSQTEAIEAVIELDEDVELDWHALTEATLNGVLEACEKYLNSLPATEKAKLKHFKKWLIDFKQPNDIFDRLFLLNDFFDIFYDVLHRNE